MTEKKKPENVIEMPPQQEPGPSMPIGTVEIRTFMHKPLCAKCREKGVNRFLVEEEKEIAHILTGQPMVTWSCNHCDHTVQLPPGAFPAYEHHEVRLESTGRTKNPAGN